jgi:hypothetical protein
MSVTIIPPINREKQIKMMLDLDAEWLSSYYICPHFSHNRKYYETQPPRFLCSNWFAAVSLKLSKSERN